MDAVSSFVLRAWCVNSRWRVKARRVVDWWRQFGACGELGLEWSESNWGQNLSGGRERTR